MVHDIRGDSNESNKENGNEQKNIMVELYYWNNIDYNRNHMFIFKCRV